MTKTITGSSMLAHVFESFIKGAPGDFSAACRHCGQARSHHIQPILNATMVDQTLDHVWQAEAELQKAIKRLDAGSPTAIALRMLLTESMGQVDGVRKLIEAARKA